MANQIKQITGTVLGKLASEQILSVYLQPDGVFRLFKKCNQWTHCDLTANELLELSEELARAAKEGVPK